MTKERKEQLAKMAAQIAADCQMQVKRVEQHPFLNSTMRSTLKEAFEIIRELSGIVVELTEQ